MSDYVLKKNLALICEKFLTNGVQEAQIVYSGGGDSGGVENVLNPLSGHKVMQLKDGLSQFTLDENGKIFRDADIPEMIGISDLNNALRDLCYQLIEFHGYSGWENNEGGSGTVTIKPLEGVALHSHTYYESDYEYNEEHSLDLDNLLGEAEGLTVGNEDSRKAFYANFKIITDYLKAEGVNLFEAEMDPHGDSNFYFDGRYQGNQNPDEKIDQAFDDVMDFLIESYDLEPNDDDGFNSFRIVFNINAGTVSIGMNCEATANHDSDAILDASDLIDFTKYGKLVEEVDDNTLSAESNDATKKLTF